VSKLLSISVKAPIIKVPLIGRNKIGIGATKIQMKQELPRFKHVKNVK
jgi:hypothetical protein